MKKRVNDLFKGHRMDFMKLKKLIPSKYRINMKIRTCYNEALKFIKRVQEKTKDQPLVYRGFISALKDYRERKMSILMVVASVNSIIIDYPALIEDFKAFIPNDYEKSSSEEDDSDLYPSSQ